MTGGGGSLLHPPDHCPIRPGPSVLGQPGCRALAGRGRGASAVVGRVGPTVYIDAGHRALEGPMCPSGARTVMDAAAAVRRGWRAPYL